MRDRFTLRRVASAPSVVTDATLLPDGDVVLRGYYRGFLVQLPGWRVRTSFALPQVEQGETVASTAHGREVLTGSEGSDSPVYRVTVPTLAQAADAGAQASPGSSASGSHAKQRDRGFSPLPPDFPRVHPSSYLVVAAAVVVLVFLAWRRRRRRRTLP